MRVTHAYRRRLIVDVMTWPSAGATRSCPAELVHQARAWSPGAVGRGESNVFGGQASKGIRWMPWLQEAMKDVVKLR
jgi:hypothetical protein